MNSIIRRYVKANKAGLINPEHKVLMDQIETKAMAVLASGSTTAGILKTRAAQSMNREIIKPIPKHSLVQSHWDHDMKLIRARQYDIEVTVAEQMVAFFSFSRKEQETNRLSFKRKVHFDRLLMEHRDGLTHNQHVRIQNVEGSLNSVSKREFIQDRFFMDYSHARDELRLLQQDREERLANDPKEDDSTAAAFVFFFWTLQT